MNPEQFKKIFRTLGISVKLGKNARPRNLLDKEWDSPLELCYLAKGQSYFTYIPVDKIIHMEYMAFGLEENSSSPFIKCLQSYQNGEKDKAKKVLELYYQHCQPKNINQYLGLKLKNTTVGAKPAISLPRLYSDEDTEKHLHAVKKWSKKENKMAGMNIGVESGYSFFGPASIKKLDVEFKRLTSLYDNIKNNGYSLDSTGIDPISGVFLYQEDTEQWILSINQGHHRAACLATLGYKKIPTLVKPTRGRAGILSNSEADFLFIVKNNTLTATEAKHLLERKIRKLQPEAAYTWIQQAKKLNI